jgi:RNA polymerase sigma-70 factor (ECF subfamily)
MQVGQATTATASPPREAACVRAYEEHFDFLYRALRRQGVRPSDLDDMAQEVFIAMWRSWPRFDGERPVRPWLSGIAFRVARNHLRRRHREVPGGELDVQDETALLEEGLAAARARALVLRILAGLPEKYRAPLVMHELDGLSVNEVAAQLALPLATVYTRMRRGRLAFAKLAGRFELSGESGQRSAAIAPTALLAFERKPLRASAQVLQRALGRVEAVTPAMLRAPLAPPRLPWRPLVGVGAAALGTIALLLAWRAAPRRGPRGPQPGALATSRAEPRARPARASLRAFAPELTALPEPERAPAPAVALAQEVAGHWRFDDERGLIARDDSGSRRDCLLHDLDPAAAWTAGRHGGAIDLHGQGWLECPQPEASTATATALSISVWVKLRSFPKVHAAVATRQIGASFPDQFFLGFDGDGIRVTSHAWDGFLHHGPIELGRWMHLAMVHELDGTTRLYVDGVEAGRRKSRHHDLGRITSPLTVGAGQFSANPQIVRQKLDGALDELRIYGRALSPAEVALLARPDPAL